MVCKIFWKQMVRDPTLHFYLKEVQANTAFSRHAGHQLNADPAGGLPLAVSPRPLPAAPLWSLRYPTREQHWPCLTSEGFGSPAQRNFHVSDSLRGSFIHAKLRGSTAMGKRLWREGSTVSISLYEKMILQHPAQTQLSSSSVVVQYIGRVQNPWEADLMEWAMGMHLHKQQENLLKLSILCSLYIPHLLQNDGRLF